ncbi:hypothetical protein SAMN04488107_0041 [Geodermatophilus saharensis]|uniref:Transposase zinc-ribbon domain-containing protein n=1 Tax=Geodermatophilus saharensis TaxID=1137994 RepID=A0A238ZGC7_9ACTN|nr:hypothetical protein SAMN04488107_0041 [Geodermatophilus saharensis]
MARGHLCRLCETYTVQPLSTNRSKCSKCGTVYPNDVLGR